MRPNWIMGSVAATALLSASPSFALTADEAWNAWKTWAESTGGTITTTSETAGIGSLQVTGIVMNQVVQTSETTMQIGDMAFTEAGDGTVDVAFPPSYTATFKDTSRSESSGSFAVNFSAPAMKMSDNASGSGIEYVFSAETAEFSLDSLIEDGEPIPADVTATMSGVRSEFKTDADISFLEFGVATDSLAVSVIAEDPSDGSAFELIATFDGYSIDGNGAQFAAMGTHPEDLSAALAEGLAMAMSAASGAGEIAMTADGPNGDFQMQASLSGSSGQFSLDQTDMVTESTYSGLSFTVSGAEIPFPQVTGALGEFTTNMTIPLAQDQSGQDFALRLVLGDVTMGEEIWSLFDVAGAFPRDPATVLLDLTGKAKMLVDIFDENAIDESDAPGEIEALNLNELRVTLGPSELTGTGAFTFDNTDLTTFDGMPAPDGAVTLNLSGGNAMLDLLVQMGLLPQDQALMARMVTGMVAKPGDGPDTLVSEIAVRPDGTILANGAPLPF